MASALRKALPSSVREIRLHFCQTSPASAGARKFVSESYEPIKKANSSLPILIREAPGVPARVFMRFERGVEKQASLQGVDTAKEVEDRIAGLLSGA